MQVLCYSIRLIVVKLKVFTDLYFDTITLLNIPEQLLFLM